MEKKKNPFCHWNKSLRCPPGESREINRVLPFKCCELEKWKMFDYYFINLVKAGKTPEDLTKIAEALTKSMVINEILKVGEEVIEKYKLFELKEYLLSVRNLNREIKNFEDKNLIDLLEEHKKRCLNYIPQLQKLRD